MVVVKPGRERFVHPHLHRVVCAQHGAVGGRKKKGEGGGAGSHGAGEGGKVAYRVVSQGHIGGGAELPQTHLEGGASGGRDIGVVESPFLLHGFGESGGHGRPGSLNPSPVAVVFSRGGVVVACIAVSNPVPDFRGLAVGPHDRLVGSGAQSFPLGGVQDFPKGALGVVIKRLDEGVVNSSASRPLEKSPGTEDVEAVGKPVGLLLPVVVVGAVAGGRGVEVGDGENGFHSLLDPDVFGSGREHAAHIRLGDADFVAQFLAR